MEPSDVLDKARSVGLEPRDYQSRIISKTINSLELEGVSSVLIESPTGSGKSNIALLTAKILEERNPNMRIIWTAMRRKLLLQAEEENKRIGVKNIQYVSIFDKNPPVADMLIQDECQHSAADTCIAFKNKTNVKWELGLSATPRRTDKLKLTYEKVVQDCGVQFLIQQGYLSKFDLYTINEYSVDEVASRYLENIDKWGKSIFFMRDSIECHRLYEILHKAGVSAGVVLGNMPNSQQDDILSSAEEGKIQALINVMLLTEGYDDPALKTVWVRDNCRLSTEQMVGRVLRKDPNNQHKLAHVVQSSNTPYQYSRTAKPSHEWIYSDNGWLAMGESTQMRTVISNIRRKMIIFK